MAATKSHVLWISQANRTNLEQHQSTNHRVNNGNGDSSKKQKLYRNLRCNKILLVQQEQLARAFGSLSYVGLMKPVDYDRLPPVEVGAALSVAPWVLHCIKCIMSHKELLFERRARLILLEMDALGGPVLEWDFHQSSKRKGCFFLRSISVLGHDF